MTFELNRAQYSVIDGLAYWIADAAYIRERFGDEEPELSRVSKTIYGLFDSLDRLHVPFWVQNAVICWAEDWRAYKSTYLSSFLKTRNITRV